MALIIAVSMFHNEEDIAEYVLGHMLAQGVDGILVADNLSTDRTREILLGMASDRLVVIDDPVAEYDQGTKMSNLVHRAARIFGTRGWVIPFDADEIWESHNADVGTTLADTIGAIDAAGYDSATADCYNMVPTTYDDPRVLNPLIRIQHMNPFPEPGYKVCFRYSRRSILCAGNHAVTTAGWQAPRALRIRHYPNRTKEQARYKYRHGQALFPKWWTPDMGAHWRDLGTRTDADFDLWWAAYTSDPAVVKFRSTSPGGILS